MATQRNETKPPELIFLLPASILTTTITQTMAVPSYTALNLPDETRILTISSGNYDAPITCTLTTISLSQNTIPYEALSYCWSRSTSMTPPDPTTEIQCAVYDPTGEKTEARTLAFQDLLHNPLYERLYYQQGGARPPGTITCDGVEVSIGGELYSALKRLRSEDREWRIWVDALCINQADVAERNLHVKMMGEVYARAETVRVWLGEHVGIEEMALNCLAVVSEKFDELFQVGLMGNRGAVQYEFVNDEKIRGLDWDELALLLRRAWASLFKLQLRAVYGLESADLVDSLSVCGSFKRLRMQSRRSSISAPSPWAGNTSPQSSPQCAPSTWIST